MAIVGRRYEDASFKFQVARRDTGWIYLSGFVAREATRVLARKSRLESRCGLIRVATCNVKLASAHR